MACYIACESYVSMSERLLWLCERTRVRERARERERERGGWGRDDPDGGFDGSFRSAKQEGVGNSIKNRYKLCLVST